MGVFPNTGRGSPQSQNLCYKNYPLNHLKITLKFSQKIYFLDGGLLNRGGGGEGSDIWEKLPKNPVFFFWQAPLPPIWSRSLCDQVNSIVVAADILAQQLMQHENIGYLEFSFLSKLLHCQTAILGFCRFFEFYWLPHKLSSQAIAPIFPEV